MTDAWLSMAGAADPGIPNGRPVDEWGIRMLNQTLPADLPATIQLTGFICQICTTLIAAVIGMVTFRYTRRQNALTLINQNNSLANLVNSTVLQSERARQTLGKLHSFVVGCPDDAILFMYLNYVHNTFRTHQIGAVSAHVWRDTLASCVTMAYGLGSEYNHNRH